jgi:hypothetical protein
MALKATVRATCDKCAYVANLVVEDKNLAHPNYGRATLELEVLFRQDIKQTATGPVHTRPIVWAHYWDDDADDFVDVCPYCLARTADSGC